MTASESPITHNKDWSFELRELVEEHFPGEVVIIPGWEIEIRPEQNPFAEYQVAELFLPPMDGKEGRRLPQPIAIRATTLRKLSSNRTSTPSRLTTTSTTGISASRW